MENHPLRQRGTWPKLDLGDAKAVLNKVRDLVDLIAAPAASESDVAEHCLALGDQLLDADAKIAELQRAVGALRRVLGSIVQYQGSSAGVYSVPDFELDPTTQLEITLKDGVHLVRLIRGEHEKSERARLKNG